MAKCGRLADASVIANVILMTLGEFVNGAPLIVEENLNEYVNGVNGVVTEYDRFA